MNRRAVNAMHVGSDAGAVGAPEANLRASKTSSSAATETERAVLSDDRETPTTAEGGGHTTRASSVVPPTCFIRSIHNSRTRSVLEESLLAKLVAIRRQPRPEKEQRKSSPHCRQSLPVSRQASSWERETAKGVGSIDIGEYRLGLKLNGSVPTSNASIVISEDCSAISARVWDCAVATVKWIEHQLFQRYDGSLAQLFGLHNNTNNVQILELGAGTGLLSIAFAKWGAAVMSTEYGSAVHRLQTNCIQNGVTSCNDSHPKTGVAEATLAPGKVRCRSLDWFDAETTLQRLFPMAHDRAVFDVICVTDCSLTAKEAAGVFAALHKYATKGHTRAVVGLCKQREGYSHFLGVVRSKYADGAFVASIDNMHPDYRTPRQAILTFRIE